MNNEKKPADPSLSEPAYKGLALSDVKRRKKNNNAAIPSERAVKEAKDWVDDGSRL